MWRCSIFWPSGHKAYECSCLAIALFQTAGVLLQLALGGDPLALERGGRPQGRTDAGRIREGRLTEGDDSARAYVQQLQASAPSNANTQRALHDLGAACLRKAREAALAKNTTEQERWLNEAPMPCPAWLCVINRTGCALAVASRNARPLRC